MATAGCAASAWSRAALFEAGDTCLKAGEPVIWTSGDLAVWQVRKGRSHWSTNEPESLSLPELAGR